MDEFDIYADLPDFLWLKQEYDGDVQVKKEELPISQKDVIELKTKLLKLEKVHKLVLSHYSSLWKTAKQERKRMERQIAELRSKLDNFAFRRNHHRNIVPPSVPMNPINLHPATAFQRPSNNQFDYPPPPISQASFSEQQTVADSYSYPPPLMHSAIGPNHKWNQEKEKSNEHFVDNLVVPSNVITPENSHSSDESEDDIVKKSEYRSTVYGERLRKKLIEEKRNAIREKQESVLNEKKVNDDNLRHQKSTESVKVDETKELYDLKDKEPKKVEKETDVRMVKEENNNQKPSEIKLQSIKTPYKQEQELKYKNEIDDKEKKKNDELNIKSESVFERTKSKEDLTIRKEDGIDKRERDEDVKIRKEKDFNKRKNEEELKIERERDLERKREDLPRSRWQRDIERKRKDEEIEKAKRQEQFEKRRREEEIDKRRKDQDAERRKKEEIDKRREIEKRKKEDLDRKWKEEEIERRKRDEIERRRRNDIVRKRKEEEAEKRKKEEEKKRKDRELKILKEKENAERRKEEEHVKKLREIEKNRNEKQLEELIKERKRIEKEMSKIKDEQSEEEEKPESSKGTLCKEQSVDGKLRVCQEQPKDNFKEKSRQENQSDNRRNDDCTVGRRSSRKNNFRVTNQSQTMNDNRRNGYHGYASFKSDRHQDNHVSYDKYKHSDLRSRCDRLDRERERRKSSHRSKSRNRNKSSSGYRSDEDKNNYSPKRFKLYEKDKDHRDKLNDPETDRKYKIKVKSPKRRRQTKSDERSPQKNKKRKISPGKNLDYNIKSNKNAVHPASAPTNNELDSVINNALLNENMKEDKEKLIESLGKDQDQISDKLTDPHKISQENCKEDLEKDANRYKGKIANKMETLINELFDVQERAIGTSVNLNYVEKLDETLDEKILSELEEGEITESDESIYSEDFTKSVHNKSADEPMETVNLREKNNIKNRSTITLGKNNVEVASESNSEINRGILYNMLTQGENTNYIENTKIELCEKTSSKKEVVLKNDKKLEICNDIANEADNTSSEIVKEKQVSVNKTNLIECRINKNSETVGTKNEKINVLSEVNENKTVFESSDKVNVAVEEGRQCNGKKSNGSVKVEKTDSENSTKVPSILNVLLKQPLQNCLKMNNSENQINSKEKLQIKRSEFHSETNSTKNTYRKENVEVIPPVIAEMLPKESSNAHVVKLEITSQSNAVKNSVNIPLTKVPLTAAKKVIVVRRRRRPVQLSDSPPVLVINNVNKFN